MSSAPPAPDRPLDSIAPYPQAEAGYCRQVIYLPAGDNENDLLVELSVGRTVAGEGPPLAFRGRMEKRLLPDWGYEYYRVGTVEAAAAPLMTFVGSDDPPETFVAIDFGRGILQRYNSKLPIVVYTPQGFSVRYRLWRVASRYRVAACG